MAIVQTGGFGQSKPTYTNTVTGKPATQEEFDAWKRQEAAAPKPTVSAAEETKKAAYKELKDLHFSGQWTKAKEDAIVAKYATSLDVAPLITQAKTEYETYRSGTAQHGKSDDQIRKDRDAEAERQRVNDLIKNGGATYKLYDAAGKETNDPSKATQIVLTNAKGETIGKRDVTSGDGGIPTIGGTDGITLEGFSGQGKSGFDLKDKNGNPIASTSVDSTTGEIETTSTAGNKDGDKTPSIMTTDPNTGTTAMTGGGGTEGPGAGKDPTVVTPQNPGGVPKTSPETSGGPSIKTGDEGGGGGAPKKYSFDFKALATASLKARGDTFMAQYMNPDGTMNQSAWDQAVDEEVNAISGSMNLVKRTDESGNTLWELPPELQPDELERAQGYLNSNLQLELDILTKDLVDFSGRIQGDDKAQIEEYLRLINEGNYQGAEDYAAGLKGKLGTDAADYLQNYREVTMGMRQTLEDVQYKWDDTVQEGFDTASDTRDKFKTARSNLDRTKNWERDARKYQTRQKYGSDMAATYASGVIGGSPLLAAAETKFLADLEMMKSGLVDDGAVGIDDDIQAHTGMTAQQVRDRLTSMGMNPDEYFTTQNVNGQDVVQFNSEWFQAKEGLLKEEAQVRRDFEQYFGEGTYNEIKATGGSMDLATFESLMKNGKGTFNRDISKTRRDIDQSFDLGVDSWTNDMAKMGNAWESAWTTLNPNGGLKIRGLANDYNKALDSIRGNKRTWGDFFSGLTGVAASWTNPVLGALNTANYLGRYL